MSSVLVIIPAHNEEETIRQVVTGALRHADVSVTDDGSRDRTPDILRELAAEYNGRGGKNTLHIITHEQATHIPRGLQDGLRFGVSGKWTHFITMDAGMSHDPEALSEFIAVDSDCDVVIGSRRRCANVPLYRRGISLGAARLVNYALTPRLFTLCGPGIHDCTSGFRRYSRRAAEIVAAADLRSKSFDFHMEALSLCVRAGMSTREIPINYVFSNSSFNMKVLRQAMRFGMHLLVTKRG